VLANAGRERPLEAPRELAMLRVEVGGRELAHAHHAEEQVLESEHRIRVVGDRPLVVADRLPVPRLVAQDIGEKIVGVGVGGVSRQDAPHAVGRLVEPVRAAMGPAQDHERVPVGLGARRLPFQKPLEIRERVGVAGLQRQGLQGPAHGFVPAAQGGQRQAKVVAGGRVRGVARQRLRDELDRPGRIAPLQGDDAQEMQRVDALRLGRERLAIEGFGLIQAACAVMLQPERDPSRRFAHPSSARIFVQSFGNRFSLPGMSSSIQE
jgi:hypothetical protein